MSDNTRLSLLDEIKETYSSDRWSEFFSDYGELLAKWLRARQVSADLAQDIQQETLLVVLREIQQFDHNGRAGAFRCWLKQILVNRISHAKRKTPSTPGHIYLMQLANLLEDESSNLSVEFQSEHDRYLINQILRQAEHQFPRERVRMFKELVLFSKPIKEVANEYGMTIGSVRVQQHRILSWLKTFGKGLIDLE